MTGADYSLHQGKAYYCSEEEAAAAGMAPGGWGSDDCTVPTPQITGSYNIEKSLSQTVDFGGEWRGEKLDVSFKAGRTWAEGGPKLQFALPIKPRRQNADGSWTNGNYASSWDLTGTPTMTFSPELMQNLQNGILQVDLGSTGSSWTRNDTEQNYAQVDGTWHFDGDFFDSLQFGVKGATAASTAAPATATGYAPARIRAITTTVTGLVAATASPPSSLRTSSVSWATCRAASAPAHIRRSTSRVTSPI